MRAIERLARSSPSCSERTPALRLNVHFHGLFLDGVYVRDPAMRALVLLSSPTTHEVENVARRTALRTRKILEKQGRSLELGEDEIRGFVGDVCGGTLAIALSACSGTGGTSNATFRMARTCPMAGLWTELLRPEHCEVMRLLVRTALLVYRLARGIGPRADARE